MIISNFQVFWLGFSLRSSPQHLWVMWVGTESVNQTRQAGRTECLAGRPYPRDTCETQLSPSGLTLRIPVMCKAHASFRRMLSRKLLAKSLQSSVA